MKKIIELNEELVYDYLNKTEDMSKFVSKDDFMISKYDTCIITRFSIPLYYIIYGSKNKFDNYSEFISIIEYNMLLRKKKISKLIK
jgi:hypothetical protein